MNVQVQLNPSTAVQPPASDRYSPSENEVAVPPPAMVQTMIPIPPAAVQPLLPPPPIQMTQSKELLGLLRKYPIMWNGSIALKNDTANVQVKSIFKDKQTFFRTIQTLAATAA